MEYLAHKMSDQELGYVIKMTHNEQDLSFSVICAKDESEIPDLIQNYLDFLDNPPAPSGQAQDQSNDVTTLVKQQQEIIDDLRARVAQLEGV
ncbi:MAG TPA: hypothetical protein VGP45_05780 [Marinobacter sp.]|nr:hypothetical protein [Marinobacter sp.]